MTSRPYYFQAAILYNFVWRCRSLRKDTFSKLCGQLELGTCARSNYAMRNYHHRSVQHSKQWDDRWRCGRERAATVQLGRPIVTNCFCRRILLYLAAIRTNQPTVIVSQAIQWASNTTTGRAALVPDVLLLYSSGSFSTAPPPIVSLFVVLHGPMVVVLHCIVRSCTCAKF